MNNKMWRFQASNFCMKRGMSTGDSETFKGRPYQAFAREIVQNSVDARRSKTLPVKIEFSTFSINIADFPDTNSLSTAARHCKEFWAHKADYVKTYSDIKTAISQSEMRCLRISDFNTKGVIGVESDIETRNPFHALTKGSGVSEKDEEVAGGSKGVGKNAAILMSEIRTIFYSTHTSMSLDKTPVEHKGYLGVADFVSGYVDDDISKEKRDYTQGPGYYGLDQYNRPIPGLFNIDSSFTKRDSECGTDVYVMCFNDEEGWEKEVINSILNSFFVAIVKGDLEININNLEINKETIEEIINNKDIINKSNYSSLICQYRMLTGDSSLHIYDIETEYGNCDLYVLPLSEKEESIATHKCAMVRYPFMRIKTFDLGASFRVSALCIIGESTLGKVLRDIENAEHTDWQIKRIKDKNKRREIENVIVDIRKQINEKVLECLQMGDLEPLDPNGAGDFLPDVDPGTNITNKELNRNPSENVNVISIKENKVIDRNANQLNEDGNGLEPFIGSQDDDTDGDTKHPGGENNGQGGSNHPGGQSSGAKDGDEELFRKAQLSGVQYKVVSTNKFEGRVRVVFVAPIDHERCYLQVKLLDDANNSTKIEILEMKYKGKEIGMSDSDGYGPFQIKRNEKITLDIKTNKIGYFASEVKVICK